MTITPHHETVIILDFGSQYTQLIARRVREAGAKDARSSPGHNPARGGGRSTRTTRGRRLRDHRPARDEIGEHEMDVAVGFELERGLDHRAALDQALRALPLGCVRRDRRVVRGARRTTRATSALSEIGFALGGKAGSAMSAFIGLPSNRMTILTAES